MCLWSVHTILALQPYCRRMDQTLSDCDGTVGGLYGVASSLTGQAQHVDLTCRRQGRGRKGPKEMLRLVETKGRIPNGDANGGAAGLYGGLILINATSADKPRFLECRNVTATVPAPLWSMTGFARCVGVLVRPRASCDSEDLMRWDVRGLADLWCAYECRPVCRGTNQSCGNLSCISRIRIVSPMHPSHPDASRTWR